MTTSRIEIKNGRVLSVEDNHPSDKDYLYIKWIRDSLADFATEIDEMEGYISVEIENSKIKGLEFSDEVSLDQVQQVRQKLNL